MSFVLCFVLFFRVCLENYIENKNSNESMLLKRNATKVQRYAMRDLREKNGKQSQTVVADKVVTIKIVLLFNLSHHQ